MCKQKELLKQIINLFFMFGCCRDNQKKQYYRESIRNWFKSSINKSDLVRRVLNGCVLSDEDKLELLKIFYFKNEV